MQTSGEADTAAVMAELFGGGGGDAGDGCKGDGDGDIDIAGIKDGEKKGISADPDSDDEDIWYFHDGSSKQYGELDLSSANIRELLLSLRPVNNGVLAFRNGTEDALLCFVERYYKDSAILLWHSTV